MHSETSVKLQEHLRETMTQLASGERINKAADDAAGLAVSENLKLRFDPGRSEAKC